MKCYVRLCEEKDTQSLFDYFDKSCEDVLEIYTKECEFSFEHSIVRRGLYLHTNEYIAVFEGEQIIGLMSLYFYGDNTNTYYINYVSLVDENILKNIVEYIKNHNLILLKSLDKIRVLLDSSDKKSINLFLKNSFQIENIKSKENTTSFCLYVNK